MKSNKVISAFTAAMISSCFLISCNKDNANKSNDDAQSMNPAKMAAIDTNTGTYTGNVYAEEKGVSQPGNDNTTMNPNTKVASNPKGDPQLMDNPSAVAHASEQANRRTNPNIQTPVYVNGKEGYIQGNNQRADQNGNSVRGQNIQQTSTDNNKIAMAPKKGSTSENEEEVRNSYLSGKNQQIISVLKGESVELKVKEDRLQNKITDAHSAPTYAPGVKNPRGPAGAAINNEISSFESQRKQTQQQIAQLQKDNKNSYMATEQFLLKEKSNYLNELQGKLPVVQKRLTSQALPDKQKMQLAYKSVEANLPKLKALPPSQQWETLKEQTTTEMRKLDITFAQPQNQKISPNSQPNFPKMGQHSTNTSK